MPYFFTKKYWQFLLKSSNQHGVHSPFVYDLVTLCFYKKRGANSLFQNIKNQFPKSISAKHIQVLNDFFGYVKIENCISFCEKSHGILSLPNYKKTKNTSAKAIYIAATSLKTDLIPEISSQLQKNGVLILETPYKNPKFWKALKQNQISQVIVDTYFFGFIFTRKEQAKEEFYIRL